MRHYNKPFRIIWFSRMFHRDQLNGFETGDQKGPCCRYCKRITHLLYLSVGCNLAITARTPHTHWSCKFLIENHPIPQFTILFRDNKVEKVQMLLRRRTQSQTCSKQLDMTNLALYLRENNVFVFVIVYLSFLLDNVLLTVVGKS